jgi:hypothetical protein
VFQAGFSPVKDTLVQQRVRGNLHLCRAGIGGSQSDYRHQRQDQYRGNYDRAAVIAQD